MADVDTANAQRYKVEDGEIFYKVPFTCGKIKMDIVVSEYLLQKKTGGYLLTGYLKSEYTGGQDSHLYTYFMCTNMEITGDEPSPGPIYISGKIAKSKGFRTLNNGKQILPIVIRHRARDGHTSILHAVLCDKEARYAASLPTLEGSHVDIGGTLQTRYNAVELRVTEMSLYGKEGEVIWATNGEVSPPPAN